MPHMGAAMTGWWGTVQRAQQTSVADDYREIQTYSKHLMKTLGQPRTFGLPYPLQAAAVATSLYILFPTLIYEFYTGCWIRRRIDR